MFNKLKNAVKNFLEKDDIQDKNAQKEEEMTEKFTLLPTPPELDPFPLGYLNSEYNKDIASKTIE